MWKICDNGVADLFFKRGLKVRERRHDLMEKGLGILEVLLVLAHQGFDLESDCWILDQLPSIARESILASALRKL